MKNKQFVCDTHGGLVYSLNDADIENMTNQSYDSEGFGKIPCPESDCPGYLVEFTK